MKKITLALLVLALVFVTSCSEKGDTPYSPPSSPLGGQGPVPGSLTSDNEMKMLKEVVAREPKNIEAWIKLGNMGMDTGRFRDAVDAYRVALELDPKNVDVRVDMGTCYRNLGEPGKAVEEYRKAIQIKPDHIYAHKNLGVVLAFDLKKNDQAIKAFQTYLKLSPNAPDALQISNIINELKKNKS